MQPIHANFQDNSTEKEVKKKRWTDEESDFLGERFKGYNLGIKKSIHQSGLQEAQRKCLPIILPQIRSKFNIIKLGK